METDDLGPAARAVVRSYSFEVDQRLPSGHPAHSLGQVLAQDRGDLQHVTQPWRYFYEASNLLENQRKTVTKAIAVEATRLRDKWLSFYHGCSEEDKLDLQAFEPTMEGIVDAIKMTLAVWDKKRQKGWRGKAASNFHKFCESLDSHSNVLKMLPQNNEYVCIFSGALSTIIQASVNHEKIVEGLSQALCEIGEHVRDCTSELDLFPTEQMQGLVSDLYAHIFLFLVGVMDWIMQKKHRRLLDSFNQNFMTRFKEDIDKIKRQAERIRQVAAQASRAEGRVSRLTLEDTGQQLRELHRDLRVGLEDIARKHAELAYWNELKEREVAEAWRDRADIGRRALYLTTWLTQILQQGSHTLPAPLQSLDRSTSPFSTSLTDVECTSDQALIESQHFEDFFDRRRIQLPVQDTKSVTIPRNVLHRLTEWSGNRSATCSLLWLKGEPTRMEDLENPLSILAAQFIDLVKRTEVPVTSYFCELPRGDHLRKGNKTIEQQALVALGYALTRQMMELLLPHFRTAADFSDYRFGRLDGTAASWNDLLSLLRDLVPLMPETVYVIVDGLHWLDDSSTDTMMEEFLSCLKKLGGNLHVLFSTSGRSGVLLEELDVDECVGVQNDLLHGEALILDRSGLLSEC